MVEEAVKREDVEGGVVGEGELVPVLREDSEGADGGLEGEADSWSGMKVRGVTLGAKVNVAGVTEEAGELRSCLTGGILLRKVKTDRQ